MKIGIDIQALQTKNSKNRGIGRYVKSTLDVLFAESAHHEYQLYANANISEPELDRNIFPCKYINYLDYENKDINELIMKTTLSSLDLDGIFLPSPMEGTDSIIPNFYNFNKKIFVICYDLIPLIFEDRYLSDAKSRSLYMQRLQNIRNADFIFAISESTRQDTISYLNKSPDRVLNISGGVSDFFAPISSHEHQFWFNEFARKFNINKKIILYTGGEDWRKNIEGLISAFAKLPRDLQDSHQLVIACKISDTFAKEIARLSSQINIDKSIVLTGYITDLELRALYSTCSLFVFPSFYEGFGLPLLEAIACGAPAIASNNSSLPEILGSTELLFNPHSPEDIANAMQIVLSDLNLQQRLSEQLTNRAAQFTWESVGRKISDVFSEERALPRINVLFNRVESESNKMQLAFFSPFKPIKSGIADYTHDLLPSLSQKIELFLYHDDDYTPAINDLNQNISPSNLFESDLLHQNYESIIYQIGNSNYHCYMYSLLMRYPGISVLHDYALGGLINYMDAHRPDLGITLLNELEHSYGLIQATEIVNLLRQGKSNITDLVESGIYINRRIFTRSLGVILHSKWAYKNAIENYSQDNDYIVCIPQIIPQYIPSSNSIFDLRNKLSIPKDSFVISTFGFINVTKRPLQILRAFKQYSLTNPNALLFFVGGKEYIGSLDIESEIHKLALKDRVRISGYVDMQSFYEYIEVSDVCLNLRFPFNGESSAALLRILSVGKPTVVTDIGSFSDFPDDVVVKIPQPEHCDEVAEILQALNLLTANIEYRNSLSDKSSAYVALENSPQRCAELYMDFIQQVLSSNEAKQKMLCDSVSRELAKLNIVNTDKVLPTFSKIVEQTY